MNQQILGLLRQVEAGTLSAEGGHAPPEDGAPFEEVGNFAKLDHHRALRQRGGRGDLRRGQDPEQIQQIA